MRHTDIHIGDRLRVKRDNPYGFPPDVFTVTQITTRDGYKVPWIWGTLNRAPETIPLRPSDFSGRAT